MSHVCNWVGGKGNWTAFLKTATEQPQYLADTGTNKERKSIPSVDKTERQT